MPAPGSSEAKFNTIKAATVEADYLTDNAVITFSLLITNNDHELYTATTQKDICKCYIDNVCLCIMDILFTLYNCHPHFKKYNVIDVNMAKQNIVVRNGTVLLVPVGQVVKIEIRSVILTTSLRGVMEDDNNQETILGIPSELVSMILEWFHKLTSMSMMWC